ncbi:MAG: R3H domain-containing nucleic acid-binding protein [bacterium]
MIMEHNPETIKETIARFFEKMTIDVKIDDLVMGENTISVSLTTDEPQTLIGENGQVLNDLQQILRLVLRRQIDAPFFIDIDINNYKEEKTDKIKEIVRGAIDEVIITGRENILPPMSANERRIVHMEIGLRIDVKSESVGEGPERRVVIKPAN